MLPLHRIVCPMDFSEPSHKALRAGIEIAVQFRSELIVLHVIAPAAPGIPTDPTYAFAGTEEYEKAVRTRAEEQLTVVEKNLPQGLQSRTVIRSGEAAEEIVRFAKQDAVDLIVISTHGLTGWRHLVFGSIAEKVIRLSERPVLVIPAREPA
jgi:nucleotide-binding universal stress UspA family protein